ncbi:phosphatidylinositol 3,4,5-trisphosphate 5-phosphatase 2-like isoform X2 [Apostichopus japonicus]|uniref:phosphatidylinositol 3,4,5-trisphosphate 5-phosphatase 2-like isoform X2 n=1 Tax=Stichopus japonicus TaxID=307972 RepID=UPI003AB62003
MAGISSFQWYHGNISRLQTERLLQEHRLNGSYLVRDSENIRGAYVLCVWCDGQIYQYRILPTAAGKFQMKYANNIRGDTYSNVSELITSVSTQGLYCPLRNPVPVAKEDYVDTDDDDEDDRTASLESNSYSTQEQSSRLLLARLNQMDISSLDREFVGFLNNYVTALMESDFNASSMKDMPQLKTMMEHLGRPLKKEAEIFLVKMKVLHSLFDLKKNPTQKYKFPRAEEDIKLTDLLKTMANCQNEVRSVEKTAYSCFQTLSISDPTSPLEPSTTSGLLEDRKGDSFNSTSYQPTELLTDPVNSPKSSTSPSLPVYPAQHFEVRQEGRNMVEALKSNKMKLTVNVTQGFLTIVKSSKDLKDEIVTYKQDTIAQLVKSRDNKTRLMIAFNNGKKKEYSFEHAKQREYFCQLVQSMKLCHTNSKEVDQISVFIGSWNMGDAAPPSNFLSWLLCQGDGKQRDKNIPFLGFDVYVIGTQESSLSERDWLTRVKNAIKQITPGSTKEYHVVTLSSLWGIRLTVLVKPDHQHRISNVRTSSVKTGIANALGNKGAVGVSFYFSNTCFCFINSHLTSGTEKMLRRNQNYHDILKGLNLGSKGLSVFDLTNQFHHLYFLGDLNYRVEWNVQDILQHINKKDYATLLKYDQLMEQQNKDEVFVGFKESEITFPPTYRYELGLRSVYAYKKIKKTKIRINEPSWCDRVLWRSYPGTYNENITYGCSKDIVTSDHSPVFATFLVGILPPSTIAEPSQDNQNIKISFLEVEATIMTSMCGRNFVIEFHSSCLEAKVVSKTNGVCEQLTMKEVRPVWKSENLPELVPIFPDSSYLEDQHLLLSLKSEDSDESYGECVVELKDKFTSHYVRFSTILTHHGHKTGYLRGQMHIKAKDESLYGSAKKIRTYELISFDDPNRIQYYDSDSASAVLSPPSATAGSPTGTRVKTLARGPGQPDILRFKYI